ncbi:MAG: DUF4301 family protein [Nitritalea sp.]
MTENLKEKIAAQGMDPQLAEKQIQHFEEGFPFLPIVKAATLGAGITKLDEEQLQATVAYYEKRAAQLDLVKFVPASGAASRMFKDLFAFLEGDGLLEKDAFTQKFIQHLDKFAFYEALKKALAALGKPLEEVLAKKDYKTIVSALLEEHGLGYGALPKGLLQFHRYTDEIRTAAQEHFIEGIQYARGKDGRVRLHFTVSPEHQERFELLTEQVRPALEAHYGVEIHVSFSTQKKATDTIAVTADNEPFLEEDGSILFRPAGHGALLENLNDIQADIIFIKNIDNVVPDHLKPTTKTYKQALAGVLLQAQEQVFELLHQLEKGCDQALLLRAEALLEDKLGCKLSPRYYEWSFEERVAYVQRKLNRPLRACGMVKNTGEPGGGPFWVEDADGTLSLQIAETAQIDLSDPAQQEIVQTASHFNPVDLVCATKDYTGKPFDLLAFRDEQTGFITEKSKSGKVLKAQELPGLWNGAMAGWNTLFVEVPILTFNPVKTVNDLLREEHQ